MSQCIFYINITVFFFRLKKASGGNPGKNLGKVLFGSWHFHPQTKNYGDASDPVNIGPTFAGRLRPPVTLTHTKTIAAEQIFK